MSVIWIDFKGKGHMYGSPVEPGKIVDINTYAGHKWAFRATGTRYRLCTTDGQNVWSARPWTESRGPQSHLAQRIVVGIRTPAYQLAELCLMTLKPLLRGKGAEAVEVLDIPASLKADLANDDSLDYFRGLMSQPPTSSAP